MIELTQPLTEVIMFNIPLISFFLLFACSAQNNQSAETLEEIAVKINEMVGEAEASDAAYCEMMPIGVKPAGGPWGYLVFSSENLDTEELTRLVERYNELDDARNEDGGFMSTGDVATEPELQLVGSRCRGIGLYAWNPGFILEFNDIDE